MEHRTKYTSCVNTPKEKGSETKKAGYKVGVVTKGIGTQDEPIVHKGCSRCSSHRSIKRAIVQVAQSGCKQTHEEGLTVRKEQHCIVHKE